MEPDTSHETPSVPAKVKQRNLVVASVIAIFIVMMFFVTIFKLGPAILERGI